MKKILVISLLLAMVMALVLPSAAMAAHPMSYAGSGILTGIDTGIVKQLGDSGLWRVRNRTIDGIFNDGPFANKTFTLKYEGVFSLETQEGNLTGKLKCGNSNLSVVGQVAPLDMVPVAPGISLPMLTITGSWTAMSGGKAQGTFYAFLLFIPDGGHVGQIVNSAFYMYDQGIGQ